MAKKWIQDATKNSTKGSLTRYAKKHRLMNKDGTIALDRAHDYAERNGETHRIKQINFAKNVRNLRKR